MLAGYGVSHVFMVRRSCAARSRRWSAHSIRRIHTMAKKRGLHGRRLRARFGQARRVHAQVVGALNLAAGLRDAGLRTRR